MPYDSSVTRGTNPTYQTGANGANPLIPVEVQQGIIKGMTAKSAVLRMAKTMRMSRQLKTMPVLNALPSAYWVNGDTGLKQTSNANWKQVMLTAEELAVVIPDAVLKDSDYDIWGEIRPLVDEAFGKKIDEAVLFGIDKPSSWPNDLKAGAIAAGNTVTDGTGVDIAADVNNVLAALGDDGYGASGIVMQQGLRFRFQGLRDTTNGFIFNPGNPGAENAQFGNSINADRGTLFNVPAIASMNGAFEAEDTANANAASLFAVDWTKVIVAIREDISVDFSKSAVIHDAEGLVTFNAWQQDMTAARFVARFAYAVPNPVNRIQTTEASRWPAAILRESA